MFVGFFAILLLVSAVCLRAFVEPKGQIGVTKISQAEVFASQTGGFYEQKAIV